MKREHTVVDQQIEDGGMMAIVSELPRAVTQGRTMQAARGRKTERGTRPTPLTEIPPCFVGQPPGRFAGR